MDKGLLEKYFKNTCAEESDQNLTKYRRKNRFKL
jgi:hypothetical protein